MSTQNPIIEAMHHEFNGDWPRVVHTLTVLDYASQIGATLEADKNIVEAAAILHDIGIPASEKKHGSSNGRYQEMEGPPIARRILRQLGWPIENIERVCHIVANHHSSKCPESPEFCSVWDADWLVNIPNNRPDISCHECKTLVEKTFRTAEGKRLAHETVMQPRLAFRRAEVNDIPLIQTLADEIWRQHFTTIISEAQIEYMLDWMYNPKTLRKEIESDVIWQLIEVNGKARGYLSVLPEPETQKLHASKIYLLQTWQNRGLGQRILQHITRIAKAFELSDIYLRVNRNNDMAVSAYKKHGFNIDETCCVEINEQFIMDDYIMTLKLNPEDAP